MECALLVSYKLVVLVLNDFEFLKQDRDIWYISQFLDLRFEVRNNFINLNALSEDHILSILLFAFHLHLSFATLLLHEVMRH